jgi:hypothetical protein
MLNVSQRSNMTDGDQRFYVPESLQEQLALARTRVGERKTGLMVMGTIAGAAATVYLALAGVAATWPADC